MDTWLKIITAPYRIGRFVYWKIGDLLHPGAIKCQCGKRLMDTGEYQKCPNCGAYTNGEKA